jgi:cobalamin biosynthesis protein CobT
MRATLAFYLWRIKARNQTRLIMYRNRVWYIDNPRAATVDRWWRA